MSHGEVMNLWDRFNKWEGAGCVWFVIILLAFNFVVRSCRSTTSAGPCASVAPEDQQECLNEYYAHPAYDPTDRYSATAQVQLTENARDQILSGYPDTNSNTLQMSCPNGCTIHADGCDIKGNISFDAKEKIYHVPGQEYYAGTVIDPAYGERWFCTEAEALSNGFRRSYK